MKKNRRRKTMLTKPAAITAAAAALLLISALLFAARKKGWLRGLPDKDGFIADLNTANVPEWGNKKEYIAIHFTGVPADGHSIPESGIGAHFYIYADGTIYQTEPVDAVMWQVGTAGKYTKLRPEVTNYNTVGIEMCPRCDGDREDARDETWYFTEETQQAAIRLTRRLEKELGIPDSHVLRHGDIVNKWCPAPYLNNNHYKTSWTWDEFLAKLAALPEEEVPAYPIK